MKFLTFVCALMVAQAMAFAEDKSGAKEEQSDEITCDEAPAFTCRSPQPTNDKFIFVTGMLCIQKDTKATLMQTMSVARVVVVNSESKLIDQTVPVLGFYQKFSADPMKTPAQSSFHFYFGMTDKLPDFTLFANFLPNAGSYIHMNKVKVPMVCALQSLPPLPQDAPQKK